MAKIESISFKEHFIPQGSSGGTGYDEYARLRVTYSDNSALNVNVSTYYQDYNRAFIELYESLASIENPSEAYDMLVQAIGNRLMKADKADLDKKYLEPKLATPKSRKIYRIRKLTPRECGRLMGVSDKDIDKIQAYPFHLLIEHPSYSKEEILAGMTEAEKRAKMKDRISESQQYKMFGNSIVVNVLEAIFTQLFRADQDTLF